MMLYGSYSSHPYNATTYFLAETYSIVAAAIILIIEAIVFSLKVGQGFNVQVKFSL